MSSSVVYSDSNYSALLWIKTNEVINLDVILLIEFDVCILLQMKLSSEFISLGSISPVCQAGAGKTCIRHIMQMNHGGGGNGRPGQRNATCLESPL